MRRLVSLSIAALLTLALAGPAAAGPNVGNFSGSAITAQGSWESAGADGYTFGYLAAWQEAGTTAAHIELFEESGAFVDCTPEDETDDSYGFQGTYRYGSGEGTLAVGRSYADATAGGTIGLETVVIDDCAGTWDGSYDPAVPVSLDLVADGPKVMERGTWSFHIPSEYNGHGSYSSTYRTAVGTVTIGADEQDVSGGIGKVSWRDHFNG